MTDTDDFFERRRKDVLENYEYKGMTPINEVRQVAFYSVVFCAILVIGYWILPDLRIQGSSLFILSMNFFASIIYYVPIFLLGLWVKNSMSQDHLERIDQEKEKLGDDPNYESKYLDSRGESNQYARIIHDQNKLVIPLVVIMILELFPLKSFIDEISIQVLSWIGSIVMFVIIFILVGILMYSDKLQLYLDAYEDNWDREHPEQTLSGRIGSKVGGILRRK